MYFFFIYVNKAVMMTNITYMTKLEEFILSLNIFQVTSVWTWMMYCALLKLKMY